MTDIIGPIMAIILIFIVYYISTQIDISGETKVIKLKMESTAADTVLEQARAESRRLEVKMGQLAIEARKLDKLAYNPDDATETDFEVLEDKG